MPEKKSNQKKKSPEDMTQAQFEAWRIGQGADEKDREWNLEHSEVERKRIVLLLKNLSHRQEVIDKLMLECVPEVDRIFEAIKYKGWGPSNINDLRKKRALNFFDKHKGEIFLVQRDMLKDDFIYRLTNNVEKPHFRQKLIAKIIKYWLPNKINARDLRKKITYLL